MLTKQEKSEWCLKAFRNKWSITDILYMWERLGFESLEDMRMNVVRLSCDKLTADNPRLCWNEIYWHWLEYQYAAIDGRIEVAKSVSQDNIFRAMLAI